MVKLRHKDKAVRCRLFVVPGDSPAIWGVLDIELVKVQQLTGNFTPR